MIESLRRRAGRFGLDLLLVNIWEGERAAEEIEAYCQRWGIEATVLLDDTASYARGLGVRGVPTNVFVDEAGVVRAVGATTSEELLAEAARLEPRLADVVRELLGTDRTPFGFAESRPGPGES